jgi:hypothetical protein
MKRFRFTAEMSEAVRVAWHKGEAADTIAVRLGVPTGEKVAAHAKNKQYHRRPGFVPLRLVERAAMPPTSDDKIGRERANRALMKYEPKPVLRDGQPVTLMTVKPNECRWTHDDGALCANRTTAEDSYCPHHCARAYSYIRAPEHLHKEIKRAALFAEQVPNAR